MGEYMARTIRCYECNGEQECGILFSASSNNNTQYLSRFGNKLLDSCSVSVSD